MGSHITFYSNVNVDYIKIDSDTSIDIDKAIANKNIMKSNTVLLTKYSANQVDAMYFDMSDSGLSSIFTIYKKTPAQKYYNYVCTLTDNNFKFTDYNILSNQFYHYLASIELPRTADGGGADYEIYENLDVEGKENYIHETFDGWSICDILPSEDEHIYIKNGRVWNLGYNIEGESLTHNYGNTSYDTLGKYARVSIGNKNYKSMGFTGLLGNIYEYTAYSFEEKGNVSTATSKTIYGYTEKLEQYNQAAPNLENTKWDEGWNVWDAYGREVDKLNAWDEFITNGEYKLLRDMKGNAWVIQVADSISSSINITAINEPTTISFQWKEVMDVKDISVVVFGENTEGSEV